MSGTPELLVDDAGGVRTARLNRPERLNALTESLLDDLRDVLVDADTDPAVRVIVLTGSGRAFCAGGDLGPMAKRQTGNAALALRHAEVPKLLRECRKPTIAAINGPAAGGGLSLALAADLRIMSDTAFLTAGYGLVGLSGDLGGTYALTRLVGLERATRFYMLNERWDPVTALTYGAVGEVVPAGDLLVVAAERAANLAAGSAPALARMKHNLRQAERLTFAELLHVELYGHEELMAGDDFREGAAAFSERRPPVFREPAPAVYPPKDDLE